MAHLEHFKSYQEVIDKIIERLNDERDRYNEHFTYTRPGIEDVIEITQARLDICINGLLVLASLNRDKENAIKILD